VFLTPQRFDRAEAFFVRHGSEVVTIARFVEGLRQLNGIIAGTVGMHWPKFILFNAVGAALWVATWTSLGYLAGSHVETISRYFNYFAIAGAVTAIAFLIVHLRRRRKHKRASS
jgi:membrane protein DedA with SNARE-associated domain